MIGMDDLNIIIALIMEVRWLKRILNGRRGIGPRQFVKKELKEGMDIFHRKPLAYSVPLENIQQCEGLIPGLHVMKLAILFKIKRKKEGQEEGDQKEPFR